MKKELTTKTLITKKSAKKIVKKKATVKKSVKTIATKETTIPIVKKIVKRTTKPQTPLLTLTDEEKKFLAQHTTLKLQIELVPQSCFFSNIRSVLKDSQWDTIRRSVYVKANYHCEICGEQGTKHPVECHEVWIYEEETTTQRLGFFQALCPLCHEVKHIGLALVRGNSERASNRFKEVNQLDKITSDKILSAVWKQWRLRTKQEWKFEIQKLTEYNIDITSLVDRSSLKRQISE